MVGKMTLDKSLLFILCFLLAGCAANSNLPEDAMEQIVGIYKHKEPFFPESTLELRENYTYRMHDPGSGYEFGEKTRLIDGKWKYSRGSVILNSFLNVDTNDYNGFIEQVSTFGFHCDSIVLRLLSLYDDKPFEDFGVVFRFNDCSREDTLLFSDEKGMIFFPRDGVQSIIGIYGLYGMEELKVPPTGYYYIVHIIDCDFSTHKNVKLQRKGDTLIMRSKIPVGYNRFGIKQYKTRDYPFVKDEEATRKEETPSTTP